MVNMVDPIKGIYRNFSTKKVSNCQSQQLSSALSSACDFKNHFYKQCGPRSDCCSRSSLIRVHTVCLYAKIGLKSLQYSADEAQTDIFRCRFSWHFKGYKYCNALFSMNIPKHDFVQSKIILKYNFNYHPPPTPLPPPPQPPPPNPPEMY